jgi:hypothetical protein
MTNDEIKRVIDQLQRKHDEKREESTANAFNHRGYEAAGFMFGLSYAIGALEARIDDDQRRP